MKIKTEIVLVVFKTVEPNMKKTFLLSKNSILKNN